MTYELLDECKKTRLEGMVGTLMDAKVSGVTLAPGVEATTWKQLGKGWCLACYLVINWRIQELVERSKFDIPNKALSELAQHLYAYIYEDKMPPAAISSVVLNMAEPFMKGEPVRLGPGDYIALQDFIRAKK
jgi:hypothetical protein